MHTIQIHQFSPSAHYGDGITNGMFYFQKILQELGFTSHIYAENIDKALKGKVLKRNKIDNKNKNQILFIHYSIYYDFATWIEDLILHKHMIYHNITPHEFFEKGSLLYDLCKRGKEYLPDLSSKVEGSIGDSLLNTEELQEANFKNPKTIPLLMDVDKIVSAPFNHALFDEKAAEFNIIFIGRVAQNKAQHDLIEIAKHYKNIDKEFKLYIIGGVTDEPYKERLGHLINSYALQENVILAGKIPNEDLYAYYRAANLFLCMSEHEGFGMPLVESMLFDLPVFAFNSSNIKSTLNGGGLLFDEKDHKKIAATINILKNNPSFKTEILNTQREAREVYNHDIIIKNLLSYLKEFDIHIDYTPQELAKKIKFQFEGPFDSSYSLSMLNRHAALAYEKEFPDAVALFATEGPGDFQPSAEFLQKNPLINKMHNSAKKALQAEVVFRDLYPPRVTGMKGELNILSQYCWEESGFPLEYVNDFNQNLDGITVISNYTKKVLQTNGVTVPIHFVSLSLDHILNTHAKAIPLQTQKSFKFLHISSCFPRKGVDILLKAYAEAFTKHDDVTLIIKTFPNPHNDIESQIAKLKELYPDMPEILLINKDLESSEIKWLYENTNALVAPSRGEGFGLPMAEAMMTHLPVITTDFGGQVDFCKPENAWLIDYEFAQAQTHLNLFNSYWVEPSQKHLSTLLYKVANAKAEKLKEKTDKAYKFVYANLRDTNYVKETQEFIGQLKAQKVFDTKAKEIAWVSSYNTKCGIASYSEFILENLDPTDAKVTILASETKELLHQEKEHTVKRCWVNRFQPDNKLLIEQITQEHFDSLLINFNFGFFSMPNLATIIDAAHQANKKITIIFHSVDDVELEGQESSLSWILPSLKKATHLLVHTINDLNALKNLGLTNIDLLPHGVQNIQAKQTTKSELFTIASYGFMLPHKGILELIEAFALVHQQLPYTRLQLLNALYPDPVSEEYANRCKAKVEELNLSAFVNFDTEYLDDAQTFAKLSDADLIVLPYLPTQESSSASVRHAIATRKPVLCTDQAIFNDVKEIVHFTPDASKAKLSATLLKLIQDRNLLRKNINQQNTWIKAHDWKHISQLLYNLL